MRKIRVGSRESKLAVIQTQLLIDQIKCVHPEIEFELITMKTTGDMILNKNLDKIGGKGLFVKELDIGLREKQIDIAVHSLKDMPMETPEDLPIISFSRRENPFDALVLPLGTAELDLSKPFGCSSARRSLQLQQLYPDIKIDGIRGNVLLRLQKVDGGEYGGTILACAGLNRMDLQNRIFKIFSVDEMIPSAGQGILAVQGRANEDLSFLACVNDTSSQQCALAERAFVRGLNGGCSSPIAAYAFLDGQTLHLKGLNFDDKSKKQLVGQLSGKIEDAEKIGYELADILKIK